MLDAFHRCNLRPSDFFKFTYVMTPLLADPSVLPCINLVLSMGWINSPDLFCAAYETVDNNANIYALDPDSTFVVYPPHDLGIQDR